jgi:hypothetical protein
MPRTPRARRSERSLTVHSKRQSAATPPRSQNAVVPIRKEHPASVPLDYLAESQSIWIGFDTISDALLRGHRFVRTVLDLNRRLSDGLRDVARNQQDFALDTSERLLQRRPAKPE